MPDVLIDKVPPSNLEAEQATLGSMMIEPSALLKGLEILKAQDFYRPAHQEIFNALATVARGDEPVDLITLQEELRKRGKLDDVGGTEYLMALVESVPTAANIEYYAKIVERKSILRKLIAAGTEIIGLANNEIEDVEDVLGKARQVMLNLERKNSGETTPICDVVEKVWNRFEEIGQGKHIIGVPYGIPSLDALSYGVEDEPQLTIIAARPSNGKTVLLNKLAISAAKAGKRVLYYSLETSMKQLVSRMQFMISGVDSSQFRMHQWQNDEEEMQAWQKLAEAAEITRSFKDKILLRDIRPSNVSELTARVSQEMLKTQIDMIFIDYIQLLDGDRRFENRTTEMQYVCQRVKKLCTLRDGAQIPVVVAAQLSRASTKREDKKPTSEDLREGGNMEAEADKIVLIHNPPPVEKNKRNEMRSCELILSKHKDGPTGTVGCYFLPGCMRFGEYASDLYE